MRNGIHEICIIGETKEQGRQCLNEIIKLELLNNIGSDNIHGVGAYKLEVGTLKYEVYTNDDAVLRGRRFDQVLITGTLYMPFVCRYLLDTLNTSCVPEEFQVQYFGC